MGHTPVGPLIPLAGRLGACGGHDGRRVRVDAGSDGVDAGVCPAASAPMLAGGDPTFGSAGLVALNSGPTVLALTAIAAQSDGKLVGARLDPVLGPVVRLTAAGALDCNFGSGGLAIDAEPFGFAMTADDE